MTTFYSGFWTILIIDASEHAFYYVLVAMKFVINRTTSDLSGFKPCLDSRTT